MNTVYFMLCKEVVTGIYCENYKEHIVWSEVTSVRLKLV
jgi:hypothetical protein